MQHSGVMGDEMGDRGPHTPGNLALYIGLLFLAAGVFLAWKAVSTGAGSVHLFLIFPVFTTTSVAGALAVLCLFTGFVLLSYGVMLHMAASHPYPPPAHNTSAYSSYSSTYNSGLVAEPEPCRPVHSEKRFGGVVLIGPIPIVFGSDRNMATLSILVAILMLFVVVFFVLSFFY